ncbi:MAG: DUF1838 family protein [Steroidobacteraceae bacterium]|nr:DUF1838 family protein [Nevskiaceae bacterium]
MSDHPGKTLRNPLVNRRKAIGTLGAAGSLLGLATSVSARGRRKVNTAVVAARLPIRDPAFNVMILGKLQGDLSGKTVYSYQQGRVFGLVPGDGPALGDYGRLLYRMEGGSVRSSRLRADGAVTEKSRGWLFYRDAETNAYISEFANPYTGETVSVPTFRGGITGGVVTVNGPELIANFPMESSVFNRPMLLDWHFFGERAWIYRHAFTRWREGASGVHRTEMTLDCWVCDVADVANEGLTHIPSSYSWTSQTEWQSWLRMRGKPGAMLWRTDGFVVDSIDQLPKEFVAQCERMLPGQLASPLE